MLFSATMPKQMAELASAYLSNPVRVEAARPGVAADKVRQCVHFVLQSDKRALLANLLAAHPGELALVFARTKHGAERLSEQLGRDGFEADSIHGNKRQRERQRTLDAFRRGQVTVLVATDVAARGIDIPDVRHVYNFDLPNVPENYVHRIGRTARAGAEGQAIAFCAPHEMADLKAIQRALEQEIDVVSGRPWRDDGPKAKPRGKPARPSHQGQRRRVPEERAEQAPKPARAKPRRPGKPRKARRAA